MNGNKKLAELQNSFPNFLSWYNEHSIKLFLLTRAVGTRLVSEAYVAGIKIYGRKKGERKYQEFLRWNTYRNAGNSQTN